MSVKILGGVAKSYTLAVPKGDSTRPTSVMLRRRLFDSHQDWEGMTFVDLCAGTGAMGLEALSRGAKRVVLVENNKRAFQVLKSNSSQITQKYEDLGEVSTREISVLKFLENFRNDYESWSEREKLDTVLFLDPPYELKKIYESVLSFFIGEGNETWFKGDLWIESDSQKGLKEESFDGLCYEKTKSYSQGSSYILIFRC